MTDRRGLRPRRRPRSRAFRLLVASAGGLFTFVVVYTSAHATRIAAEIAATHHEGEAKVAVAAVAVDVPAQAAPLGEAPSPEPEPEPAPEDAVPSTTGEGLLRTSGARRGHRIFVDGRTMGQTPDSVRVACGVHRVRIGSEGKARRIDVPCDGEVELDR